MIEGLGGKVAVVTGGGTGIGRAAAQRLVDSDAQVLIVGRRPEPLDQTARELGAAFHACDVSAAAAPTGILAAAVAAFGRVDLLVNNAALDGAGTELPDLPDDSWSHVLEVNVTAVFRLIRELANHLRARSAGGSVVNVSSINAIVAERAFADYNTSKGALLALTRSAAVDLAGDGIRVNAICPGYVETEMTAPYLETAEMRARIEREIPLGRVGSAEEIGTLVAFLLSDQASYITGATIVADGGRTAGFVGAIE
jgi:NAD(P)-dependent dehydrogenase (short-subunit alcohol dehydrogenase family)